MKNIFPAIALYSLICASVFANTDSVETQEPNAARKTLCYNDKISHFHESYALWKKANADYKILCKDIKNLRTQSRSIRLNREIYPVKMEAYRRNLALATTKHQAEKTQKITQLIAALEAAHKEIQNKVELAIKEELGKRKHLSRLQKEVYLSFYKAKLTVATVTMNNSKHFDLDCKEKFVNLLNKLYDHMKKASCKLLNSKNLPKAISGLLPASSANIAILNRYLDSNLLTSSEYLKDQLITLSTMAGFVDPSLSAISDLSTLISTLNVQVSKAVEMTPGIFILDATYDIRNAINALQDAISVSLDPEEIILADYDDTTVL